jgi:hypothetical protein
MPDDAANSAPASPPPRAFTQGVGTIFQFLGVTIFLGFFFTCCLSGLLSRDVATQTSLTAIAWGGYTAQRAVSICMVGGVTFGLALAGIGLGLQAQRRLSPLLAVVVCGCAMLFWTVHAVFFIKTTGSIVLTTISLAMAMLAALLLGLAAVSLREMRRNPPPIGHETLPPDYKVPYSHLHDEPPELRLARELEERRHRLDVERKELEALEEKLRRKLKPSGQ